MITFVIALENEASPLIKEMKNLTCKTVHGKKIYFGTAYGKEIAVLLCGVGKVNAAAGTQFAIDSLNADKIINIGYAGGLNAGVEIGGVYEVESVVQYDFDLAQLNGTEIGRLNEFDETYLPLARLNLYEHKKLGTGDRFNDDKKDYELLTKTLGADLRDMECGAIAQVCAHASVPLYSFKAVSDIAGSGSTTEQYLSNIALCTRKMGEELKRILGAING